MLYKELRELEDCNLCPFYNAYCKGGITADYNGNPIEPPCCGWSLEDDIHEQFRSYEVALRQQEDYYDRQYKAEQERKRKNELARQRRLETKRVCYSENHEIKHLKKCIVANNKIMSLHEAFNFASNMVNNVNKPIQKHPLEVENARLYLRIAELEQLKKQKMKELRKRR